MSVSTQECCVLNSGNGAWAFEPLANRLSSFLGVEISDRPRRFNYLLHTEKANQPISCDVFIPMRSIEFASDKRLLATVFAEHDLPTPATKLFDEFTEVSRFIHAHFESEWCLKYPTSCGAHGHRMLTSKSVEPVNWPRPFIVQEFIRLARPEVFRTYCAAREIFGWVVRRFPNGTQSSSWVAHARGARYETLGEPPEKVREVARKAFKATGLWDSFGCVDVIQRPTGEWLVLEVGTDGVFNYVDRDVGDDQFELELNERVAKAFWISAEKI